MPIDPVNSYSKLPPDAQVAKKTAAEQTEKTDAKQPFDKVSIRDKNLPFKLFSERMLNQLKSIVGDAAARIGVDPATFDPSPESVSDMISGFAIANFGRYHQQHPEMSEQEALDKYQDVIGGAINKGYNEAIEIIQGLGIDDEKTMDTIGRTHDLIFEKLDRFFAEQRERLAQQMAEPEGVVSK